jgi:hypothetical protein
VTTEALQSLGVTAFAVLALLAFLALFWEMGGEL